MNDAALPRLLYIGDVSVADTMGGEALLFRLLQFYPPEILCLVCGDPGIAGLPGVKYHAWSPAFPRLFHSRFAESYILWRAWRYYEIPPLISHVATMFKPDAILTISHVSGWLGAWQLAEQRRIPFHLIAHDDFAYASRFPAWSRDWASRKFGKAYRAAATRFCISDSMEEMYQQRFGAAGQVIYPTFKASTEASAGTTRDNRSDASLTFGYGGSLNTAEDIEQVVTFARIASARGHRLLAFTPQHALVAERAAAAGVPVDARPPVHSDDLKKWLRAEADCLLLPQSMSEADLPLVSTAFPTKWADYSTLGLAVLVWAPAQSSSARFVNEHPGCAEVVTTTSHDDLTQAIERLERGPDYRRALAETLLRVGRNAFAPEAAWRRFQRAIAFKDQPHAQ